MPTAELVGRDEVLALAARRWAEARDGHGQVLLVAGEAGIGKSRMLNEIVSAVGDVPVVRAAAWPRDAEISGALLLDIASGLRRAGLPAAARLSELFDADAEASAGRARRRLVADATELLIEVATSGPALFALDDLHWADELSLDVLQRLAVGLSSVPALLIAGYRSDELFADTPAARWRARLLQTRTAEEARLPRLDVAATTRLVTALAGEVPSTERASVLYQRSNGIPLHVEELVAAGSDARVPETVAQAVLLRAAELGAPAMTVVEAAAVIGREVEEELLAEVSAADADTVDAALIELRDRHFLVDGTAAGTFDFRHALIRDAISERIPPARRRTLHARVAHAGKAAGLSDAELSDHFERAGSLAEAFEHALAAAAVAGRSDAHREAAALYGRAVRTAPAALPARERGRLHARHGLELQLIDKNEPAAEELERAIELLGTTAEAVSLIRNLMSVRYRLGEPLEQRVARAQHGLRLLALCPQDDPSTTQARGILHAALATAYMLDRRLEESIREAELGLASITEVRDEVDVDATLGSVLVFAGRADEGWALLERGIELGLAEGAGAEWATARGFQMLGSTASVVAEYDRAEATIDDGLVMTAAAEIWGDHHYLRAHRAHVRWATGHPDAASDAAQALADGGALITEITALHVLGYAALGRADHAETRRHLARARELAAGTQEVQRLSPALWGLAESAMIEGDTTAAIELTDEAARLSARVADAAYLFPHVVTGARARLAAGSAGDAAAWIGSTTDALRDRGIPGTLPAIDHAEGLVALAERRVADARELLERARDGWDARRRFWEGTWVRLDLARVAQRARRPGEEAALLSEVRARASSAGAPVFATLAARDVEREAHDLAGLGPLTEREYQVAKLVAEGATNRQIAEQLVISPKTASAHIEHILAKLQVSRRAEIAAWVSRTRTV